MRTLDQVRQDIDQVDRQMTALFEERMHLVAEVIAVKQAAGLPVLDAAREEVVVEKNTARLNDQELARYYEAFIRKTMELSKEYQRSLLER